MCYSIVLHTYTDHPLALSSYGLAPGQLYIYTLHLADPNQYGLFSDPLSPLGGLSPGIHLFQLLLLYSPVHCP